LFQALLRDIDRSYHGAGRVDPEEMQLLLDRLEEEGNLTPIEVYRRFKELSSDLKNVSRRMMKENSPSVEGFKNLSLIRDELGQYLSNKDAEYYDAFKAKYDWCQLILSLKDNSRFNKYLELMLTRKEEREPRTAAPFTEIRYTE
jgi:hypothetical protein